MSALLAEPELGSLLAEPVQVRAAQVEEVDRDHGTILMRAVPYGVEARLEEGLYESFERGAFAAAGKAPHRVKLYRGHTTEARWDLIGHATEVRDERDGSWITARFSNTVAGQESRELASDGTLDHVSVEFMPMRDWMRVTRLADGLHVRHARAYMKGCALVPHGAYGDDAYIAAVRDADSERAAERAQAEALEREAARRAAVERLSKLRA